MSEEGLSIAQLLLALQRKGIPLPFEMGTFLVLETTEQVLTLEATAKVPAFCRVVNDEIWLSDQGEVSVQPTQTASEADACHSLVMLLGSLLVRSAPGVPPMLLEIVEQGPSDGEWTLLRLRDDLEAALVPLNRAATRRVLARLLREVHRDAGRSQSGREVETDAGDDELDVLLGLDPEAAVTLRPQKASPRRDEVTAEVELDELLPHGEAPARSAARAQTSRESKRQAPAESAAKPRKPRAAARANVEQLTERHGPSLALDGSELDEFERAEAHGKATGMRIGLGLALIAAAVGAGYLILGQQASRSALGLSPTAETAPPPPPAPAPKPPPRVGELRVTSTPGRAQVLMLVGKAPAVVTKLPTGVAYEFVAIADGYAPSRAVVPASADWPREGDEPRYELALQLNEASPKRAREDLGATRLDQDVGRPTATLGSVRVITSPPGAKVYQLIGFTPDVKVENMPIDEPVELLVYLSGYAVQHVSVAEADWKQAAGGFAAQFELKLEKRR